MNTRIQVEHPVSEMVTNIDLVALQLLLSAARPLDVRAQEDVVASGHAIECRLYAERPAKNFLPSTGVLSRFRLPKTGPTLRVDTGVREGDRITHFYDPMIAKVIAHGRSRHQAIDRLLGALEEIEITGVESNLDFLRRTIGHPAYRASDVTTSFVERYKSELVG